MNPDEREFTNRNSPPGHRCCQNPLCLRCLMRERDNYEEVRYYPRTGERLFLVQHCRHRLRQGDEEGAA